MVQSVAPETREAMRRGGWDVDEAEGDESQLKIELALGAIFS